jgi:hypothetical protein
MNLAAPCKPASSTTSGSTLAEVRMTRGCGRRRASRAHVSNPDDQQIRLQPRGQGDAILATCGFAEEREPVRFLDHPACGRPEPGVVIDGDDADRIGPPVCKASHEKPAYRREARARTPNGKHSDRSARRRPATALARLSWSEVG